MTGASDSPCKTLAQREEREREEVEGRSGLD